MLRRVQLDMTDNLYIEIEILARVTGVEDRAEVLSNAISYYSMIVESASEGKEILVGEKGKRPTERLRYTFKLLEPYSKELGLSEEPSTEVIPRESRFRSFLRKLGLK